MTGDKKALDIDSLEVTELTDDDLEGVAGGHNNSCPGPGPNDSCAGCGPNDGCDGPGDCPPTELE
jgi:hypothetical protein